MFRKGKTTLPAMKFRKGRSWPDKARAFDNQRALDFAELWARHMQAEMAAGKRLEDVATPTAIQSSQWILGDHDYAVAGTVLIAYWKHGQEFRKWHDAKLCAMEATMGKNNVSARIVFLTPNRLR